MRTAIVGVDGSGGGAAALEFAAEEARARDARLRVVSVWELAPTLVDPPDGDLIQGLRAPADAARAAYEYLVAIWPDLDRTVEALEGIPERVLARFGQPSRHPARALPRPGDPSPGRATRSRPAGGRRASEV